MTENKLRRNGIAILGITFIAYSVIVFVLPWAKRGMFFVSYLFTVLAFAAQYYVFRKAFADGETVKSRFYGFPIAKVGILYLLLQLIFSILFMGLAGYVPVWAAAVVYIVLLAAAAVGLIAADVMRGEVEQQDVKLKVNVTSMRELQSRINLLAEQMNELEQKRILTELADSFRYSDPVSNSATEEAEVQLSALMNELEAAAAEAEIESVRTLARSLTAALNDRNRLCRLNK